MTTPDRPKLLYLAQRHPRYTAEEFTPRWRQHAALGMSQARWRNVARYLHCDRIEGLPDDVGSLACDGIAIVEYRSEAHRQAHIADEVARRTMKADEADTFAQPVARTSVLTLASGVVAPAADAFRLFVFWTATTPAFESAWLSAASHWRQALPSGTGLVCNRPVAGAGELDTAGVDELMAGEAQPLVQLAARWVDESRLPGKARLVLTRTVVLHDQPEA